MHTWASHFHSGSLLLILTTFLEIKNNTKDREKEKDTKHDYNKALLVTTTVVSEKLVAVKVIYSPHM